MRYRLLIVGLSLLLYGIALSLPCLLFNVVPQTGYEGNTPTGIINAYGNPDNIVSMTGLEVTIWGIFGLLFLQIPAIGWLANPLYWACCVFFVRSQSKIATIFALTAVFIGFIGTISAFWLRLPNGSSPFTALLLEKLLLGFWVWLAAPGLVAVISVFRSLKML